MPELAGAARLTPNAALGCLRRLPRFVPGSMGFGHAEDLSSGFPSLRHAGYFKLAQVYLVGVIAISVGIFPFERVLERS